MICPFPACAHFSAPRLGKLGDRIGPVIPIVALIISVLLLIPMSFKNAVVARAIAVSCLARGGWRAAAAPLAKLPLVYNSTNQIAGRIYSVTNRSFRDGRQRHRFLARTSASYVAPALYRAHSRRGVVQCHLFMEQLTTAQTGTEFDFCAFLQQYQISYSSLNTFVKSKGDTPHRHAEAIDAAREEFLADHPARTR